MVANATGGTVDEKFARAGQVPSPACVLGGMSRYDENMPFDIDAVADRLRADRPRPSDEILNAARTRVMGRMKSHQGAAMPARTKTVALLTGGLLLTTGAATAAVTQTNNQSAATNQAISQASGGGVVIGGGDQNAQNNSNTNLNNSQLVGAACAVYCPPTIVAPGLTLGRAPAVAAPPAAAVVPAPTVVAPPAQPVVQKKPTKATPKKHQKKKTKKARKPRRHRGFTG